MRELNAIEIEAVTGAGLTDVGKKLWPVIKEIAKDAASSAIGQGIVDALTPKPPPPAPPAPPPNPPQEPKHDKGGDTGRRETFRGDYTGSGQSGMPRSGSVRIMTV